MGCLTRQLSTLFLHENFRTSVRFATTLMWCFPLTRDGFVNNSGWVGASERRHSKFRCGGKWGRRLLFQQGQQMLFRDGGCSVGAIAVDFSDWYRRASNVLESAALTSYNLRRAVTS